MKARWFILFSAFSASMIMPCWAEPASQQTQIDALTQRIDDLEQRLKTIETQIQALQNAPRPNTSVSPLAQQPAQWKKLEPGMSPETVLQYLGAPQRKMTINGRALWYYDTPHGVGSVLFTLDNKVSSTQEPPRW